MIIVLNLGLGLWVEGNLLVLPDLSLDILKLTVSIQAD